MPNTETHYKRTSVKGNTHWVKKVKRFKGFGVKNHGGNIKPVMPGGIVKAHSSVVKVRKRGHKPFTHIPIPKGL